MACCFCGWKNIYLQLTTINLKPMASYWIIINGEKAGPYEQERLGAMGINPDTKVWNPTLSGWTPASEVAELAGIFPPPVPFEERMQCPPPIPQAFEQEEPEREPEEELPNSRLGLSIALSVAAFVLIASSVGCDIREAVNLVLVGSPFFASMVLAPVFSILCRAAVARGNLRKARVMSRLALAFNIVMLSVFGLVATIFLLLSH